MTHELATARTDALEGIALSPGRHLGAGGANFSSTRRTPRSVPPPFDRPTGSTDVIRVGNRTVSPGTSLSTASDPASFTATRFEARSIPAGIALQRPEAPCRPLCEGAHREVPQYGKPPPCLRSSLAGDGSFLDRRDNTAPFRSRSSWTTVRLQGIPRLHPLERMVIYETT